MTSGYFVDVVPHYHWQCLSEFLKATHWGLEELGAWDTSGRRILLGAHVDPKLVTDEDIVYQTEVPSSHYWKDAEYIRALRRAREVWDYSTLNADRYADFALPRPKIVPLGWAPVLEDVPQKVPGETDIDVLFIGSLNERRLRVVQACERLGLNVVLGRNAPLDPFPFGKERAALMARSKVILNVHYYEGAPLEQARVVHAMANRKTVVSEASADDGSARIFLSNRFLGMALTSIEYLPKVCADFCSSSEARDTWARTGYAHIRSKTAADYLRPVLL